jgi:LPS-assembly lipoprotein
MTPMQARQLPFLGLHRSVAPSALVALASALTLAVGGCGFHLQGSGTLPPALAKTYLHSQSPHSDFLASITEALRLRGTEVVTAREQAESVLDVTVDQTGQRVLSVTARNIPREYEVYYAVTFSLLVGQEKLIDSESLVVTRSYTYDETEVLAKASEEQVLREALADDLARRVVRRIEALGATAALPPAAPQPTQP